MKRKPIPRVRPRATKPPKVRHKPPEADTYTGILAETKGRATIEIACAPASIIMVIHIGHWSAYCGGYDSPVLENGRSKRKRASVTVPRDGQWVVIIEHPPGEVPEYKVLVEPLTAARRVERLEPSARRF